MEQKIIITEVQYEVQSLLDEGWSVVSVTAQHIASGTSFSTTGKFCIILERVKQ
jgi:hypothetical protein